MAHLSADTINAIEPVLGLYISDITVPRSPDFLKNHGITHVLSITSSKDCPQIEKEMGIEHLHIELDDNPFDEIVMCLEALDTWTTNSLASAHQGKEGGQQPKVLVHCVLGQSRSGAIIVAALMRHLQIEYDSALVMAQKYRPSILPNSGFADQLRLWQKLDYSILKNMGMGDDASWETKEEYEKWKEDRGILMTKQQRDKQEDLMRRMVHIMRTYMK